jgi:hypothetical protein
MGDKALGVASSKAAIDGGTIDGAIIGGTTPVAGTFTNLNAGGNVVLGDAITDTVGHYGVTPITQRAGATQATSLVSVTSASFATAYAAALLEIMNTLTALGLWKGGA